MTHILCILAIAQKLGVPLGFLRVEVGVGKGLSLTLDGLGDPFPLTGLPPPALMWRYMPGLIVACCCPWVAGSFLSGGVLWVDHEERECGRKRWERDEKEKLWLGCICKRIKKRYFKKSVPLRHTTPSSFLVPHFQRLQCPCLMPVGSSKH